MRNRVPSFFLLVPGPWRDTRELVTALGQHDLVVTPRDERPIEAAEIRVEIVEDGHLAAGFAWGRQGRLPDALVARVGACSRAALVEIGQRFDENPKKVAALGRALRDAGGVAVRMEASGLASPWEPWLERLSSGDPFLVYASAVVVVGGDGVFFTCGMHHFDLPDAQIGMRDAQEAIAWLDTFCVYQLAEQPALVSGHTFRPDEKSARRVLERWPDHRHSPSDGRHNPFGLWRFLEPGVAGVQATALVSTIMPSLVALLMNAERSKG